MIFRDFYTDEITFRELLFEGTKPQKLKDHVDLIFIDVHDSYSIDKNRKRLW